MNNKIILSIGVLIFFVNITAMEFFEESQHTQEIQTKKTIQEIDAQWALESCVRTISSSNQTDAEKIDAFDNLFMQALCSGAIKDPYEKQFYGPSRNDGSHYINNIFINETINFSSIMEFAIKANMPHIMEQSFKNGANPNNILEDTFYHQKLPAIVQALKYCCPNIIKRTVDVFKKYDANFNVLLPGAQGLLHHHIHIPAIPLLLMLDTNISVNQQNYDGNTVAHVLPAIHSDEILIAIFNAFIIKNLNVSIQNFDRKTAKEVALDHCHKLAIQKQEDLSDIKDVMHHNKLQIACRKNACLLNKLENGYSSKDRFTLENGLIVYRKG